MIVTVTVGVGVFVGVGCGVVSNTIQNVQSTVSIIKSNPQVRSQLKSLLISQPLTSIIFNLMIGAVINIGGNVK